MSNLQKIAQKARQEAIYKQISFYSDQTDQLLETSRELIFASQLLHEYHLQDSEYYYQMYCWLNSRYDYVMEYAMSFIPYSDESSGHC